MKITLKMENGAPIIFHTDDPDSDPGKVTTFTRADMHSQSSRAYMRSLRAPVSQSETLACFDLLATWAAHCAYTLKL
jgi:hypothetical protein